jgi:hypothetical protein
MRQLTKTPVAFLVLLMIVTSCSASPRGAETVDVTSVIDDEDYFRFAIDSLDAYKIACYAISKDDWIIAAQKWAEGDELSEAEGKLVALGLSQAMEARLRKGQNAVWNGKSADEVVKRACSNLPKN